MVTRSALVWLGAFGLLYLNCRPLQRWLYTLTDIYEVRAALVDSYQWMKLHHAVAFLIGLMILGVLRAIVLYVSSDYRMGEETISVRMGFGNRHSPEGFFVNYTNTLACSLVLDVNIPQNPIQFIFNTGHIEILMAGGERVLLMCVANPKSVRDTIMSRTKVTSMRYYSSMPFTGGTPPSGR